GQVGRGLHARSPRPRLSSRRAEATRLWGRLSLDSYLTRDGVGGVAAVLRVEAPMQRLLDRAAVEQHGQRDAERHQRRLPAARPRRSAARRHRCSGPRGRTRWGPWPGAFHPRATTRGVTIPAALDAFSEGPWVAGP